MLLIEFESDLLQNRLSVRIENRMLSHRNEPVIQLTRVGHVEIASHHQVLGRPVVLPEKGMTRAFAVSTGSPVTEMSDIQLPAKVKMMLDGCGLALVNHTDFLQRVVLSEGFLEDPG